jgi:hypothetical protein
LLMLADSMLPISRSTVIICAEVCSSWCSKAFLRRRAALATAVVVC